MKKLMKQMFLAVGSLLILGVAANGQISQRYNADIPFDFNVGNTEYSSGKFTLTPLATNSGISALALLERKSGKMRVLGIVQPESGDQGDKGHMTFVKQNGRYLLTEIITPTFSKRMKKTWTDVRVAKNGQPGQEYVAINLH